MKSADQTPGKRSKSNSPKQAAGKKKKKRGKVWLWLFFVALLGVVCAVVGYLLVILNGERILSSNVDKLNDMDQASVIVDSSGTELSKLYVSGGNREYVMIKDIPEKVREAFVAVEDKRFYEHSGIDLWGIGRALVKDIIARSAVEGASTITQQVAKNIFLTADKTLFRKGTEASIALALENHKSKDEILELYLNRIYFGKGQWGIKTAAKYYFDVDDLNDLKTWQIATLVGIPKGPNVYNPINNPEKSLERRGVVLSLMEEQGLITEAEKQEAMATEYVRPASATSNSEYTTYIDYVVDEAQEVTGWDEEKLLTGGYTIVTTINTAAQKAMEKEFADDSNFEKSDDETKIQGAMVIMDQHDGSLVAMVGGRDYEQKGWNRVTKARQPGSSFKPIVSYGPAIETGDYFPWSILRDDKTCYNNGKYCPTDSNAKKYIGAVSMADAIKESRNQPAVWLLNEIGVKTGVNFAAKLGIELGSEDRNLAIALGGLTNGVSPLQMVTAYSTFANGGQLQKAHSISKITDSTGETVYEFKSNAKQVIKETTAYYVTDIMKGVVSGGTGTKAKISGRTVAGKTGTTQLGLPGVSSSGNRDVWFVGYTPEWTAAVWMGYDKTDEKHYVKKSSGQAAALFSKVMSAGLKNVKKQTFPTPSEVQKEEPTAPNAILGLVGEYNSQDVSVELNWTAVAGEGITYKIYRKDDAGADFAQLGESAEPSFTDLAILPEVTYTYYVTAYDAKEKLESEPSSQVTVTVTTELESSPPPEESPPPSEEPSEPPVEQPTESPGTNPGDGGVNPGDGGVNPVEPGGSDTPSETPPPSESPSLPANGGDAGTGNNGNGIGNGNGNGNSNGNGNNGSGAATGVTATVVTP
ncbi:transglycosylase domain-containing protein [Cohnella thailandensis]|uniref:PBP1A family penicillin-binding protein n=1 Tax=Cohnella thailandensis TaxID=557557 RepID=A0A841T8Z4_9BACL|nr:PBP1A family penicillin-binding protein [Cohnella thailandensis]MBB6638327.1 PBP1A family penicillin-binding protein [Cohnella thailandensis]MBP1977195.1 penicillin-binding protein 2A [Cohnella thailandensis]